jgi:antitoxin (DNA-binding transcriptional repressor) of toxin-antitoxin stability system
MIQVNTHEVKTRLSWLLSKVENEYEKVIICRNGKPVAVLSNISEIKDPLKQHTKLMSVQFHEDPTAPLYE